MKKKKNKQTIPVKVLMYLKRKKIAVTKRQIMKGLRLSKGSVDRACRILRKNNKIGYTKSSFRLPNVGFFVKTYWGIK